MSGIEKIASWLKKTGNAEGSQKEETSYARSCSTSADYWPSTFELGMNTTISCSSHSLVRVPPCRVRQAGTQIVPHLQEY